MSASKPLRPSTAAVSTRASRLRSALLTSLCAFCALTLLAGCDDDGPIGDGGVDGSVDPTTIVFRFEPDAEGFFRMPWPSDARLTADGTPDLSDFPRRGRPTEAPISLVERDVRGFATMPVVYLPLAHDVVFVDIPRGDGTLAADSPLQLVDLSEQDCGARVPLDASFLREGDSLRDENVLRVANEIGTVLTPGHPYGLVVLRSFGTPEDRTSLRPEAFDVALRDESGGDALSRSLEPLRRCASGAGLDLDDIALATVFTPQDPVEEMQRLRDFVMDPSLETRAVDGWARSDRFSRRRLNVETHVATVEMPVFQEGESPYDTGGSLVFDDEGVPVVQRWEEVPMVVAYGRLDGSFPGPRPVLVFQDGTGWSPWGHLTGRWVQAALDAGYVVASFMPQFHGERAGFEGNTELSTFNLPNPPAGRSNFRQQAAETSYFLRVIRERVSGLDGLPELDLEHIVYGGHSQGALVGALVAGVESEYDAYALNGLSSFLTLTILNRKDIIDFAAVVSSAYAYRGDLDRYSLLLQLLQTGGEAVDPHNYIRRWAGWEANPSGNHVFVINGLMDDTTTPDGIRHLHGSGLLPRVTEFIDDGGCEEECDPEPTPPLSGSRTALDGSALTHAFFLDDEGGHFTVYREEFPRAISVHFWNTSRDGTPVLGRTPDETDCADGLDDNGDGLTDCADATCGDRAPCAEELCGDGDDDDGDELIDCDDPDCDGSGPCTERSCNNDEDDDGDGATDCDDPDCVSSFLCGEAYCTGNVDEDGDGLTDCADPDCDDSPHCVERDCGNGADDDGDGDTDCDDSQCARSPDCFETRCSNEEDEDGDGDVDCADSDCQGSPACPELMCTGGTDEDLDGLVDCDDPTCSEDAACARAAESDCSNGTDDDGDGEADCRDADCATFATCAAATCADGTLGPQTGIGLFTGTLVGAGDDLPPGDCTSFGSGDDTQDLVLAWTAPAAGTYLLSTAGSEIDTVLHVLGPTCDPVTEVACDDDEAPLTTSALELTAEDGESFAIVVSGYDADDAGPFTLHIVPAP